MKAKLLILILLMSLSSCGIHGFRLGDKGKYFQSELSEDFFERKIKKIGVYVFSKGATIDGPTHLHSSMGWFFFILPYSFPELCQKTRKVQA